MLDDLASCCHKQHRQCCQSSLPQAYQTNILRALLHNSWAHSFELLPFCFLLLLLHTLLILALGLLKTFQVWQVGRNPSFCSETYQNDSTPFRKYKNTTLLYIVHLQSRSIEVGAASAASTKRKAPPDRFLQAQPLSVWKPAGCRCINPWRHAGWGGFTSGAINGGV